MGLTSFEFCKARYHSLKALKERMELRSRQSPLWNWLRHDFSKWFLLNNRTHFVKESGFGSIEEFPEVRRRDWALLGFVFVDRKGDSVIRMQCHYWTVFYKANFMECESTEICWTTRWTQIACPPSPCVVYFTFENRLPIIEPPSVDFSLRGDHRVKNPFKAADVHKLPAMTTRNSILELAFDDLLTLLSHQYSSTMGAFLNVAF